MFRPCGFYILFQKADLKQVADVHAFKRKITMQISLAPRLSAPCSQALPSKEWRAWPSQGKPGNEAMCRS